MNNFEIMRLTAELAHEALEFDARYLACWQMPETNKQISRTVFQFYPSVVWC